MAVGLGLVSGLVEGLFHIALQRLNILENVWYEIVWIAAFFNALALATAALVLGAIAARTGSTRFRSFAVFSLAIVAVLPCLALGLKEWMKPYAILILTVGLATAFTRWFDRHPDRRLALFRRSLPWVAALTVLIFAAMQGGFWMTERMAVRNLPAPDPGAPNILVIVIDALRADHLSSYGYSRATSPNIDRLAAEGVLFERAFSTASYTLPSHASILTGLYPRQHGVEWLTSKAISNPAFPTLGEVLQRRGYRTAAFSGNTFWFAREHGFGRGFHHFEDYFHNVTDMFMRTSYGRMLTRFVMPRLGYDDIAARKHATDTNPAVLSWLGKDDANPFFVFINYMDVHDPYLPPQPYRSKFSKNPEPGGLINWQLHMPSNLTADQLQSETDAYDGAIAYVDDQIDVLLKGLQQRQSSRPLLVVITSDHGEEFKEHGNLAHGHTLYRETIHVPLIFWQPGRVPQGLRVSLPVSNSEIASTITEFLGGSERPFAGPPLQALWSTKGTGRWDYPLAELHHRPWAENKYPVHYGSLESVMAPDWHCIQYEPPRLELFDWTNDFAENNNLADKPEMAHALAQCRTRLDSTENGVANKHQSN